MPQPLLPDPLTPTLISAANGTSSQTIPRRLKRIRSHTHNSFFHVGPRLLNNLAIASSQFLWACDCGAVNCGERLHVWLRRRHGVNIWQGGQ
jgi:hypothetical protein